MDYFHSKRFMDTLADWEQGQSPSGPLENYLPRTRALLERLGSPQDAYTSIIVGGTNGKGTVCSLLAALLDQAGRRVGLYSSPHLHTWRERIRVNRALLSRDEWAAGITDLYNCSRDFLAEGLDQFSKYEALTALAAYLFAQRKIQFGVFEVGLGGRYDAANAWDSQVAVLTSIALDHVEVLGGTLLEIAADKSHIARPARPLYTTAEQDPKVLDFLRRQCRQQGIPLYICAAHGIEGPQGVRPYPIPSAQLEGQSQVFRQNARLALAVADHLLDGQLSDEKAAHIVTNHHWPGRFERARQQPLVILDGAHNPAAAQALRQELGHLAPRWTFVLAVKRGHDAAGILAALAPVAQKLLLVDLDHPRALDAELLEQLAPPELVVERAGTPLAALEQALVDLGPNGYLCVSGSLELVARARDFFSLDQEREGINEDAVLENLRCVEIACRRLGLPFEPVTANGQVVRVGAGRPFFFWRNKHPFNDYVAAHLAEDKGYQYELFVGGGVPTPTTEQVFNPFADERFNRYKTHPDIETMAQDLETRFAYPLVLKKARSSLAQGVFLLHDGTELRRQLQTLCENSGFLDNVLLVQTFVPGAEYRLVASGDKLLLAYRKEGGRGEDLNPLHHSQGRAVKVDQPDLLQDMEALTAQLASLIALGFFAADIIDGPQGLQVLELNPNPMCTFYNRDNSRADFIEIYQGLLEKFVVAEGSTHRPPQR